MAEQMNEDNLDDPHASPGTTGLEGSGEGPDWTPESGARPSLAELRMQRQAVRQGWDVPPELLTLVPRRLGGIVQDSTSERAVVAAARVLTNIVASGGPGKPGGRGVDGDPKHVTLIIYPPGVPIPSDEECPVPEDEIVIRMPDNGRGSHEGPNTFYQWPDGSVRKEKPE